MATNPPIQIGELLDVPAPGSGVKSAYHQEITNRIIHRFATTAARDAAASTFSSLGGVRCYITGTKTEYRHDGTGWIVMAEPEQTYTPTLAGVVIGTTGALNTGRYRRSDGFITLHTVLVLGTGGSLSGTCTVTLPPGITSGPIVNGMIGAWLYDVAPGALQFAGVGEVAVGGNLMYPRYYTVSGSGVAHVYASAGAPFTWAAGDQLNFFGRFPMSTPYL